MARRRPPLRRPGRISRHGASASACRPCLTVRGRAGDHADRNNPLAFLGFGLLIVAPIVAKAMQATISRQRETLADVSACQMTRYPPGLIAALEKLQADQTATHSASTATAHLWIEQPMGGLGDDGRLRGAHHWFDTHPPLEERIALLREL